MQNPITPTERARRRVIFATMLSLVGAAYLLQTATPLKLDSDSVIYLYTGASFADGSKPQGINVPLGYPVVVAALDRMGLGSSFGFVLANCVFLAIGVFSLRRLLQGADWPHPMWAVMLTPFAVPVIHSVTLPLPEPAYFAVSLSALWLMQSSESGLNARHAWLSLVAATALTVFAITLRLAGIALLPALLWSCLRSLRSQTFTRRLPWLAIALVAVPLVLVGIVRLRAFSHSIHQARVYFPNGIEFGQFPHLFVTAFVGMGEVVANLPYSRFHILKPVFLVTGIVAAIVMTVGLRARSSVAPAAVYTVSYLCILVLWPFPTSRLWMPIVPLLLAYAFSGAYALAPRFRFHPPLLRAYAGWFVLTGSLALLYTTRLAISRQPAAAQTVTRTPDKGGASLVTTTDPHFRSMERVVIERYGDRDHARDK